MSGKRTRYSLVNMTLLTTAAAVRVGTPRERCMSGRIDFEHGQMRNVAGSALATEKYCNACTSIMYYAAVCTLSCFRRVVRLSVFHIVIDVTTNLSSAVSVTGRRRRRRSKTWILLSVTQKAFYWRRTRTRRCVKP